MMIRFIASRIVQAFVALLFLSIVVFGLSRTTGDVRDLLMPPGATQEDYVEMGRVLGLDRPLPVQYGTFLADAVTGDLGISLHSRERVTTLLWERTRSSLTLASAAFAMVLAIGIPLGVVAATRRGTLVDRSVTFLAVLGLSVPTFWAGIVFIQIFAVRLGWLPAGTDRGFMPILLPAFTLALTGIAGVTRLLRSTMLEALDSEFVKLASAKGISGRAVVWKHAMKNALGPVIGYTSFLFAIMLTLAVPVEVVFTWPGIGQLTFNAVLNRDFPVVQGVVLLAGAAAILTGLLADILYAYIDPRVRYASD